MKKSVYLTGAILALAGAQAWAAVSQQEADRLGTTLTPMGANPAGNAEGTIPKWTGEILGVPKWVNYKGTGTHYPSPYPNEKPLFEITGKNYQQYAKEPDRWPDCHVQEVSGYFSYADLSQQA